MNFLSEKNTIRSGTVTIVVAASCILYIGLASEPDPTLKFACLNATETSHFDSSLPTSCGQIYASHAPIELKMIIVMIIGEAIGIIIRVRYLKSLLPSTFAALYRVSGICLNVCLKKNI